MLEEILLYALSTSQYTSSDVIQFIIYETRLLVK